MSDLLRRLASPLLSPKSLQCQGEEPQQAQFNHHLNQALLHFITSNDFATTSLMLLNGMLQLSQSRHGFLAELLHETEDNRPYLRTHAVSGFSWAGNRITLSAPDRPLPVPTKLEPLLWEITQAEQAIAHAGPLSSGALEMTNLLCLPIHDGDMLVGIAGFANRPADFDQATQALLHELTKAYASILSAARARSFKHNVLDEMQKARRSVEQSSHDLSLALNEKIQAMRTPLNAVLGHAQILLLSAQASAEKHGLEAISEGGQQLARMVDELQRRINADTQESRPNTPRHTQLIGAGQTERACKVLVVEDNPANQAILHLQLSTLGIRADIAADSPSALTKWQTTDYDLIFSDKYLPGMDGLALTRTIRQQEQQSGGHIPIIAITAAQHPQDWAECMEAGMDDVLSKPIELDEMRRVLNHWLPDNQQPQAGTEIDTDRIQAAAILDTSHIARITGSSSEMQMHDLVLLFTSTAQAELVHCGRCISARDSQAVALSMHKLKSSAQSVGALRFSALAEQLERIAKLGHTESMQALYYDLQHAIDDVERALQQLTPSPTNPEPAAVPAVAEASQIQRVLVVDDDPVACQQASLILSSLDILKVETVSCSADALVALGRADGPIDFVLTDLRMPGMDGIEFLRLLAENGYQGKLAICSGVDSQLLQTAADFANAKGLHLCGTIRKPVTHDGLATLLRQVARQEWPLPSSVLPSVTPQDILEGMRLDEFLVHFQPIVNAVTMEVVGVEALARWHGENGFIPIETVIMVAERHGLINQLSEMLLTKALIGGASILRSGCRLQLAINISANWLTDVNLPEFIMASCQATGFPVENLVLELTETGVMADLATALDVLTRLRLKGFTLAIDDFGTGYASLERLQRVPFSELKIDRSFVRKAADSPQSRTILASCIEMARKLKLFTVAEGVETEADLNLVKSLGCDSIQGWYIAKPMPLNRLIQWLHNKQDK